MNAVDSANAGPARCFRFQNLITKRTADFYCRITPAHMYIPGRYCTITAAATQMLNKNGDIRMNYIAKQLNHNETLRAKHFLYKVYAGQLGWIPDRQNPSEWVVKEDSDGTYFEDLFNEKAQWFGVFEKNGFVASGRLLSPVNSKLELELYTDIPERFLAGNSVRVEMNRIAVDKAHNGTEALGLLFREMFLYAQRTGIDYIFTGAPESTMTIIRELNFRTLTQFSYAPDGSDTAYCACLEIKDKATLEKTLTTLEGKRLTLTFS